MNSEPSSPVSIARTACPDGWIPRSPAQIPPCMWAGLLAGSVSAILSTIVWYLPTGRLLNDPVMLVMSIQALLRGLRYFDWIGLLNPIVYSVALGAAGWYALRLLARRLSLRVHIDDVRHAATATVVVSVLPVWVVEVRGVQVILFYTMATLFSAFIARNVAGLLQNRWPE